MKRIVVIVVVVAMFGWAIYDYWDKSNNDVLPEEDLSDYKVEEGLEGLSQGEDDTDKEQGNTEKEVKEDDDKVGLAVGNTAPDFELETLDGDTMKLSDYRGEKVMLNFWATWCPPCRAEMPDMQKFHENKDVTILAVNLTGTPNESEEKIVGFMEELGITFEVPLDEDLAVSNLYQIKPIPTTYMIDSNGRVQNKAFGALNYELMVQEFEKMK